ncbi:MAG: hypothetical protein SPF64_03420 [Faecalibacterium longum]|nr:hypothetical protein [Faecalibacterium prausnitzii]MDY5549382.1 hypothetical protein [Faecalibacterium longum]
MITALFWVMALLSWSITLASIALAARFKVKMPAAVFAALAACIANTAVLVSSLLD